MFNAPINSTFVKRKKPTHLATSTCLFRTQKLCGNGNSSRAVFSHNRIIHNDIFGQSGCVQGLIMSFFDYPAAMKVRQSSRLALSGDIDCNLINVYALCWNDTERRTRSKIFKSFDSNVFLNGVANKHQTEFLKSPTNNFRVSSITLCKKIFLISRYCFSQEQAFNKSFHNLLENSNGFFEEKLQQNISQD